LAALVALGISLLVVLSGSGAVERLADTAGGDGIAVSGSYAELPLAFEPNAGRLARRVDYIASSDGGSVALSSEGATLTTAASKKVGAATIQLSLAGSGAVAPGAIDRLPGVVNDLRGDDPARWTTQIPTFSRIRYEGVYPGIDLDWHGRAGTLEYDFRVAPGADPGEIGLEFGSEPLHIARNGELVVGRGQDVIRQAAPVAYQVSASGTRQPVEAAFALDARGRAGFHLGSYDPSRRLVIDPLVLDYSTYLGGGGVDFATDIAVDGSGSAYLAGYTESVDFDTVGPIEGNSASADAFVSKLNAAGNALVYSTYLGGGGNDSAITIAVDPSGAAYVAGRTDSTDFNTVGSIEGDSTGSDAYIAKLNAAGNALVYSTYLGGNAFDVAQGLALDSSGNAYVTGYTESTDFNTVGQIESDSALQDAFVSKVNATGSALLYSTYLGGDADDRGTAIAIDSTGAAYVAGRTDSTDFNTVGSIEGDSGSTDAFVSKLNAAGSALTYSTYLGGGGGDFPNAVAVDGLGAAYVVGSTSSTDFNTVGPIEADSVGVDAFISKLNAAGSALSYSTYLGGGAGDVASDVAVDGSGAAYVTGDTASSDFDTVEQYEGNSTTADAFISKLNATGSSLAYSTYLGGNGTDAGRAIAIDGAGAVYVAGQTDSTDFDAMGPIEGDSSSTDAFVSKLELGEDNGACEDAQAALETAEDDLRKAKKKLARAKDSGTNREIRKAKRKVKRAKAAVAEAQAAVDANC
jgi:hypothetical protein